MALQSVNTLKSNLLALSPSSNKTAAITAFVDVIGDFMDQVQAGATGSPGIFSLNRSIMVSQLLSQAPVSDSSWVNPFASAWEAAVQGGTISAGTVTDPSWIGSGSSDTLTVTSPSSTITTIAAAKSILISGLMATTPDNTAPLALATAIRDATLAFSFSCIGLGPPPALPPISLTFSAQ